MNFKCLEQSLENLKQVETPQFVNLQPYPQFSMTCPTPGAVVYYTTDDSYPAEGNVRAIRYVTGEPIDIPAGGVTVRACAYVPGTVASWVNRATIATQ